MSLTRVYASLTTNFMESSNSIIVIFPSGDLTGNTDTANFRTAIVSAINNKVYPDPIQKTNLCGGRVKIMLSLGAYYINGPILANTDFNQRVYGLAIEGAGKGMTEILYSPNTAIAANNTALFTNNDMVRGLIINGISFSCNNANVPFCTSYSTGGAAEYIFDDCLWAGQWKYGMSLIGSNSNSEMRWKDCTFDSGSSWISFLYSPTAANNGSDQFLNYWFTNCSYNSGSPWITMNTGGHIKMLNCDVSGYAPSSFQYLIGLYGTSHSSGVCSFANHGGRFELSSANSGIFYCEWPIGNILFSGCDMSSQSYQPWGANLNSVLINFTNVQGPAVKWLNCNLMGTHTYGYGVNNISYGDNPSVVYDSCYLASAQNTSSFIITNTNTNIGGAPIISFRKTLLTGAGTAGLYEVGETDINWQYAAVGITSRKMIRIGGTYAPSPAAAAPSSNAFTSANLPMNSVITGAWMVNTPGSGGAVAYNWQLQTGEATPTVLLHANGANLSTGFSLANTQAANNLFFVCNTNQKRQIIVQDYANIAGGSVGNNYFMIEYVG